MNMFKIIDCVRIHPVSIGCVDIKNDLQERLVVM